ncbi:MAG: CoA transferase [Geminicoccaceae bacterium]
MTYEHLAPVNPRIVCAFLSAYGREGGRAAWPGYDYLIQAEAGYFALNGEPDLPPSRFGLSIVDFMTGYAMALALVAGVLEARAAAGVATRRRGAFADVGLANLSYLAAWAANAGHRPSGCRVPPTLAGPLPALSHERRLDLHHGQQGAFFLLCEVLDVPGAGNRPRFRSFPDRLANRDAGSSGLMRPSARGRRRPGWSGCRGACRRHRQGMGEALGSAFTAERGMLATVTVPGGPSCFGPASGRRAGGARAGAALVRHTDALISAEAGYDAARIAELRRTIRSARGR